MNRSMLTTIDNPYNPFDEFEKWYSWDFNAGYHTPSFLSRLLQTSEALSETRQAQHMDQVIDDIVRENVLGIYKKVVKNIQEDDYV